MKTNDIMKKIWQFSTVALLGLIFYKQTRIIQAIKELHVDMEAYFTLMDSPEDEEGENVS